MSIEMNAFIAEAVVVVVVRYSFIHYIIYNRNDCNMLCYAIAMLSFYYSKKKE